MTSLWVTLAALECMDAFSAGYQVGYERGLMYGAAVALIVCALIMVVVWSVKRH